MLELPTGTLTLLFSDIEGSTVLVHRLGSQWGLALSEQRRILRSAFEDFGGTEMGTEGDSFFVVFRSAQNAVRAALRGQRQLQEHRWPGDQELRVRTGIHTGEPERHEEGYVGLDVHRAARIGATAHGGQVVISDATKQLVDDLGDLVEIRDLGRHRLKDLESAEHLYDVVADGLISDFPPLRSLGKPSALPIAPTPLVGRDADLASVRARFDVPETRLVTLTGPGGSGKTRLAVAVAAHMERAFPAGVYFIGLQAVNDPDLMWATIADALDVTGDASLPPADRVGTYLSRRQALLVLDNLEQIVDADHVVAALLSAAPLVSILATSRRSLHLIGENEYPVPPLALPGPDVSDPDRASHSAAVEMFVQHAQMVRPSFQLTDANTADVLAVCRRLDGLPLAIELAAARARLLSPRALLHRIDDRLGTGVTASDRPERQRTLGATIAWSYDLLGPVEQQMFRRLGVFSSSADIDAIVAVAGDGTDDPLDTIGALVDANLVYVMEEADGEPHAALLETIRHFARDRLDDAGEGDDVRLRHLRWCIDMASRTTELLRGAHHVTALDQMSVIENDVRAALDWSLRPSGTPDQTTVEAGHELLGLMTRYWYRFGNVREARGWQERGVATSDGADTESNVTLLHGLGVSMLQQNEVDNSFATFERSLQMARRLGHREFEVRALNDLAIANRQSGQYSEAMRLMWENLALAREIDDPTRVATALSNLVVLHIDVGEYAEAVRIAQESIAANERNGDAWGVAIDRLNYTAAILKSEGPEAALDRYVEWAEHIASFGDNELTIDLAELGASIHAGLGKPELAACLLGSAESQRDRSAMRRSRAEQTLIDEWIVPARSTIDPAAWDDGYAAGRELSPDAAIELAIGVRSPRTP